MEVDKAAETAPKAAKYTKKEKATADEFTQALMGKKRKLFQYYSQAKPEEAAAEKVEQKLVKLRY